MPKPKLMLEIKCAGENCDRKVYIKGDNGLSIDLLKFSCEECNLQTKTQKESKKSSYVKKIADGQLKLFDESGEDDDE